VVRPSTRFDEALVARGARGALLECFQAGLLAVNGRRSVSRGLAREALEGPWYVVAIGKAAGAMVAGALDHLGENLVHALVVTRPGHAALEALREPRVRVIESAHPLPDERSLEAGAAVEAFVGGLRRDTRLLWLISGGASSLVESPVRGISLDEIKRVNAWLLGSGLGIEAVNSVRCRMSRLKGGGLAMLARPRTGLALMISDVPGDDPRVIGSGLLHGPHGVAWPALPAGMPSEVADVLARCPARRGDEVSGAAVPFRIVASNRHAKAAARRCATLRGHTVRTGRGSFSGDAGRLGRDFARSIAGSMPGTLWVWGGESTVALPADPGRGGRNQHLALSSALALDGIRRATLLAAGTDGTDGVTADAGAVVDDTTRARGAELGLDARDHLRRADSGTYLEQCGDLLHTGPTETNVGDLVLGLREPPA
jgi:glycerate 2-kinase